MKNIISLILSILFWSVILSAQPVNKYIEDVVQPTPNSAALLKFGDTPVSHYTGIPNINIPIHTISQGPLSHSVSLNYHAGGIRVEEMASRVGLGWNLSAGGSITRMVNGIKDEDPVKNGYYHKSEELNNLTPHQWEQLGLGNRDGEPDLFSFNLDGYSGKFFFKKDGTMKPVLVPHQDIDITFTFANNEFEQFIVITPNGNRYIFGQFDNIDAYEYTKPNLTTDKYTTTWYLLRIESYDQLHTINFEYETDNYSYTSLSTWKYVTSSYLAGSGTNCNSSSFTTNNSGAITFDNQSFEYNKTRIQGKRLKKISSKTESIEFISTNNRTDLSDIDLAGSTTNKKRLDKIKISSGSNTSSTYCHEYQLKYNYFINSNFSSHAEGKRLKLNSIETRNCSGTKLTDDYKFTYNNTQLPMRLSRQRDHWGFYNGAVANEHNEVNIPNTTVNTGAGNLQYGSSNREPNLNKTLAGVLTNIKYPTGGNTTYEYELNERFTDGFEETFIDELINCGPTPTTGSCCGTNYDSYDMNLTRNEVDQLGINVWLSSLNGICNNSNILLRIKAKKGSQVIAQEGVNNSTSNESTWLAISDVFFNLIKNHIPANGSEDIRFELEVTNGFGKAQIVEKFSAQVPENIGGLRIKKITTHDGISTTNDIIKEYEYTKSLESDPSTIVSSGILLHKPVYGIFLQGMGGPIVSGSLSNVIASIFSSASHVPASSYESNHIGYEKVTEFLNGNGKIEFEFNVISQGANFSYPRTPQNQIIENGKPTKTEMYNQDDESIKSSEYRRYVTYPPNFHNEPKYRMSEAISCDNVHNLFFVTPYTISSDQYLHSSIEEELDGVTTTTEYEYDPSKRFLSPINTHVTNSDGKIHTTSYKYPEDFGSAVYVKLKNLNIITPIKTITSVDGTITDNVQTAYKNFTVDSGSFPYPWKFNRKEYDINAAGTVANTGTAYVNQATINSYDNVTGNPTSLTIDGWDPETFVWTSDGLLESRKFKTFTTSYDYHPNSRLLSKITNVDGTINNYNYDALFRLKYVYDNCRENETFIDYHYGNPSTGGNYTSTETTYPTVNNSSLSNIKNKQFYDGLGRLIQTIKEDQGQTSNRDVITAIEYDNQGRIKHK